MEGIQDYLQKIKERQPSKRIHTQHQDLAIQIAESFGDMKHIGIYMRICKQFGDSHVRQVWAVVKEMNPRNPGRYFTSCIYNKK